MNVYEKLMSVQQELIAPKNQFNSFGKYNYRSCEDILEGLKPCLKKVKAVVQVSDTIEMIGERYYVKASAIFVDCESGDKVENTAFARETDTKSGMDASQITGSSSSYARKYALNGLFCIDDVKDADTRDNRTEERKEEKKSKQTAATKIDAKYVDSIISKCTKENVNPMVICGYFGIKSLEDMTFSQYKDMASNWENIKSGS